MSKPSQYINDPAILEQINLIREGKIDRKQAAANLGIGVTTLHSRITRGKMAHLLEGVKNADRGGNKDLFQPLPPDSDKAIAYAKATQRALELHSVKRAFNEINTPELNLNYVILCRKVAEIKDKSVKVSRKGETYTRKHKEPKLPEESAIEYLKRVTAQTQGKQK